jgi:hypothetical protein
MEDAAEGLLVYAIIAVCKSAHDWAHERNQQNVSMARDCLAGQRPSSSARTEHHGGPFPRPADSNVDR